MNGTKISVITVCYNAVSNIEATIISVLGQVYENVEYIIIDGGSDDGTVDIIKKYSEKITAWISETDEGVYDAMNKGIDLAKGDWIYFLGAGDILLKVLDKMVPQLKNDKCIYYGDVYREDLQRIYDGRFPAYKLAVTNICHQAIFYPATALKKYRFNTRYRLLADHDLNMRCYGDKEFDFKYLPVLICIYEGDGVSAANIDPGFFADKMNVIRANFPLMIYVYARLRRAAARLLKE